MVLLINFNIISNKSFNYIKKQFFRKSLNIISTNSFDNFIIKIITKYNSTITAFPISNKDKNKIQKLNKFNLNKNKNKNKNEIIDIKPSYQNTINIKNLRKYKNKKYKKQNINNNKYKDNSVFANIANTGLRKSNGRNSELDSIKKKINTCNDQALIKGDLTIFTEIIQQLCNQNNILFDAKATISSIKEWHNQLIRSHNVIEGTQVFNDIRLYAIRMLEGLKPESPKFVSVGHKDRWPSKLTLLRDLYYNVRDRKCPISDRVIRSILYMNRLANGNNTPDISEVIKPSELDPEMEQRFDEFIKNKFLVKDYVAYSGELISRPHTKVVSNGPNNKPKWMTADVEAYALMNSELNSSFKQLCELTGNLDLYEYMQTLSESQNRVERIRLRYITSISDKGNRCRLVAISDYWTSVLLQPIMRQVQTFIKDNFTEVSYSTNHAKGFENLLKYNRQGIKSYDIKSWTDAFPNRLQKIFMKYYFGEDIANAWFDLVVTCSWSLKASNDTVKYNRGQGMGTPGSFDIATATDLMFLQMIYEQDYKISRLSQSLFNKVGDDLWAYDPEGFILRAYKKLDIEISEPKTKSSTYENNVGEFVSRSMNYGKDVSRISINICNAVQANLLEMGMLSSHLGERSYQGYIPIKKILESVLKRHYKNRYPEYIRTFYLMTQIFKNQPGIKLLEDSLLIGYFEFINSDEILRALKLFGMDNFYESYVVYSCDELMQSINLKQEDIFKGVMEVPFDTPQDLEDMSLDDKMWKLSGSIAELTSKVLLSRSYKLFFNTHTPHSDDSLDLLNHFEKLDMGLTFKGYGVVSSDKHPWKPRTSRLFKLVRRLRISPFPILKSGGGFGHTEYALDTNSAPNDPVKLAERLYTDLYINYNNFMISVKPKEELKYYLPELCTGLPD